MGDKEMEQDGLIVVHSYRIESLEHQVSELCKKVSDLLEKLPDRYQTKEVCSACMESRDREIVAIKTELTASKADHNKLIWAVLGCAGYIIGGLVKSVLHL